MHLTPEYCASVWDAKVAIGGRTTVYLLAGGSLGNRIKTLDPILDRPACGLLAAPVGGPVRSPPVDDTSSGKERRAGNILAVRLE